MHHLKKHFRINLFLLFGFILFSVQIKSQNVNIPDPIFKNVLLNNNSINLNGDAEIQLSEATTFSGSINIANLGVTDLTGIETFINLKELNCSNNYFGDLDLSTNLALEKLKCSNSGIDNINLTANALLHYLNCSNTSINALNLSNNPLLDTLICTTVTIFSTIDLSNNLALIYVDCSLNYLTSLVVPPNNTLKELRCGFNQNMHTVDVSGNTALTYLHCGGNFDLSSLNISGDIALRDLICTQCFLLNSLDVTTNTALETLNLGDCSLSNLDISANTALEFLNLAYNGLSTLDLTTNNKLEYLELTANGLSTLVVSNLDSLKTLKCHGNLLSHLDLSTNSKLEVLIVRANDLLSLNIQNGNNNNLTLLSAGLNPFLHCIQVDDPGYMSANWINEIDTASNFDIDCALNSPCQGLPIPSFTIDNDYITSFPANVSIINTTPNQSQYNFLWSFGDGSIEYNNNDNVIHTYNTNGRFSLGLKFTDPLTGCSHNYFTNSSLDDVEVNINNFNNCGFEPVVDAASYFCNVGNYRIIGIENTSYPQGSTFQWNKDGIPIGGANNATLIVTEGGHYSVTVYNTDGCPVVSWPATVNFRRQNVEAPLIIQSGPSGNCGNINVTLSTGDTLIYDWSTGQTANSINVTQAGIYYIKHLSGYCDYFPQPICISSSSLPATQICAATVDSSTNNIVLVWQKDINLATAGYRIYKETSYFSNNFIQIGYVSYDSLPQYIDMNSNAALNTARYRICLVDTCGGLSFSEQARPISLKVLPGNGFQRILSWTKYEGSTQNVSNYKVYAGPNSNQLSYLASVSPYTGIYVDNAPGYGEQTVYRIYADLSDPCNFNGVLLQTQSNSSSNDNMAFVQQIKLIDPQANNAFNFSIVPNPNNGNFTIHATNENNEELLIYDITGKLILQKKLGKEINNMQIQGLSNGSYFVRLINDNGTAAQKLMIVSYE